MKKGLILAAVFVAVFIASQLYFTMAAATTKSQPYQLLKTEKDYEIRYYPAATMASVSMYAKSYKELSSPGFRKLASFIFGGNQGNKSIAMTSPVHMDINDTQSSMSFVMPAEYTLDNLPQPNDASITLQNTEPEYVAAIRFGGYANDEALKTYSDKLKNALQRDGVTACGNYRFLGYNAPYQFWNRRNEIIVSVHWSANHQ